MTRTLANLAGFQAGWLVAVVGAAHGYPLAGPAYALLWLSLHVFSLREDRRTEFALLLGAGVLGYCADSMLVVLDLMDFPEIARLGQPSTLWMVSLWVMFAATLRHALAWLRGRLPLAVLFGAVGGPLAYWAGSRLGAIVVSEGSHSYAAFALEWALATPALLAAASWAERRIGTRSDRSCVEGAP